MPYQVEFKRTVDSTWTVYSSSLAASQFPVTISGLVGGTQYDVRCLARDLSGNVSAYSAISQATPVNVPVWSTVPTISFTQGVAGTIDVSQYDSKGATDTITHLSGTLPAGVTFDSANKRYTYDGAGAVNAGAADNILLADDAVQSSDADWNAIKASSVMATRFDTQGEVLDYRLLDSSAGNLSWDTSRKWFAGGSLKFDIPTAVGQNPGNWFRHLDDSFGLFTGSGGQPGGSTNSTNQGFDPPMTFELAHAIYVPASLRDTFFPGGGGWKCGMASHDGRSNNSFEIVWQNSLQRGYPQGYTQNPPNTQPWQATVDYGCAAASPDFLFQPSWTRPVGALTALSPTNPDTAAAWSSCEQAWGRGGLYSYGASGSPNAVGSGRVWKYWEQLDPHALSIGPILYPRDDWMVFKMRVDLNSYSAATNRVRWYVGRRWHTSWQLLYDQQNVLLPTEPSDYGQGFNKRYNATWMTFFHTGRTDGGGVNTSANVGWVVCRRDGGSIPFPAVWP